MEFKVEQKKLDAALAAVSGGLKEKGIPMLMNAVIESLGEGWLRLTTTDMDITLQMDCEAEITTPGAICIEGRKLIDVTRALPSVTMHFTQERNFWVSVTAGRATYRFAGVDREGFPAVQTFPRDVVKLSLKTVQSMIKRTSFAMEPPRGRNFGMKGVRFEIYPDRLRTVASDGHSLPIADAPIDVEIDAAIIFLLPAGTVPEILKLAGEEICMAEDKNHIFIQCGDLRLVTRKIVAAFPKYSAAIPKDANSQVIFDVAELAGAVRRASLMSDSVTAMGNDGRLRKLAFTIRDGEINIRSVSREGGAEEYVAAELKGEPVTLGFNAEELLKALGAFDGKAVLNFKDAGTPVIFTPEGKDDYQCITTLVKVAEPEPTIKQAEAAAA